MAPQDNSDTFLRDCYNPSILPPRKYEIVYMNVFKHAIGTLSTIYGIYLCFTVAKWQTLVLAFVTYQLGQIGVICGAHRLWSHRAYKANVPMQFILMLCNCIGYQNTLVNWVRNHRLHHKHSDTDGDPHNATRGFFFSHMGWLLVRKHPAARASYVDMSDVDSNWVLGFQRKYKVLLVGLLSFVLPTIIPVYCWGESVNTAFHVNIMRFMLSLHAVLLVNSVTHRFGNKPYNKHIPPTQSPLVSLLTVGEGFHNYHHTFPWDYKAAELGNNLFNAGTWFIDFFALIGWATDLKSVPEDVVKNRMKRTGDGTNSWGWGDNMTREERESVHILNPEDLRKEEEDIAAEEARNELDFSRLFTHDYFRKQ